MSVRQLLAFPADFPVLVCFLFTISTILAHRVPHLDSHLGNILISSGSSGTSTSSNGREWTGDDTDESSTFSLHASVKSLKSTALDHPPSLNSVPYKTARASRQPITYRFQINPGEKLIRLHFYPASYKGFQKSIALFTVKAGPYTLLDNFSPSAFGRALGKKYFVKEFCISIEPNQPLNITLFPSPKKARSDDFYAFINGVEIISMPPGLYFNMEDDGGIQVVGEQNRAYVDNRTALEMVQRLNIGGSSIAHLEDSGMFRRWDDDSIFVSQPGTVLVNRITSYLHTPIYVAPVEIYQTARSIDPKEQLKVHTLRWKIPVDIGFSYLVRLHFCELDPNIIRSGQREFSVIINGKAAKEKADVIQWSGGHGVPVYRDYIVVTKGDLVDDNLYLIITLQPKFSSIGELYHGLLNGLEIFKLSNLDNNLASTGYSINHVLESEQKLQKSVASRIRKAMENGLILLVTLLVIVGHQIRRLSETRNNSEKIRSSNQYHHCRIFSLGEISLATKNFSPDLRIGSGGFGVVYKGKLNIDDKEKTVAIKRLKFMSTQGADEFWAEIKTLSKLQHRNLVALIGFCSEDHEMILVYEFIPQGSLADQIHKGSGKSTICLSWLQRLKISIDVASGLCYTHNCKDKVIHRDLKSSNILLDENWVAKISDFGLCRIGSTDASLTHFTSKPKGTLGYLDPEYYSTHKLTWKSDVYSFGVVLLELVSGRKAVDRNLGGLATWAPLCIRERKFDLIIDINLQGQISPDCLNKFLDTAYQCLRLLSDERPSMAEVLESLKTALSLRQNPSKAIKTNTAIDPNATKMQWVHRCKITRVEIPSNLQQKPSKVKNRRIYGTLSSQLHKKPGHLPWISRLKICKAAAESLFYLLLKQELPGFFTSDDIVLYGDGTASFEGSGMSMLSEHRVLEYLDPEHSKFSRSLGTSSKFNSPKFSGRPDVYSFGVILLEVLSGRRPTNFTWGDKQTVVQQFLNEDILEFVDPSIAKQVEVDCLFNFVYLAMRCLCTKGCYGPSPRAIHYILEGALWFQESSDDSDKTTLMTADNIKALAKIRGLKDHVQSSVTDFFFPSNPDIEYCVCGSVCGC